MITEIRNRINAIPEPIKDQLVWTSLLSTAAAVMGLSSAFYQIGNRLYDNGLSPFGMSLGYSMGMSTYCWTSFALEKAGISGRINQVISFIFATTTVLGVYYLMDDYSTKTKFILASCNIITHAMICLALRKEANSGSLVRN